MCVCVCVEGGGGGGRKDGAGGATGDHSGVGGGGLLPLWLARRGGWVGGGGRDDSRFLLRGFESPAKWCIHSAVWLLHGWCHVKLMPPRRDLRTPLCKATYAGSMRV